MSIHAQLLTPCAGGADGLEAFPCQAAAARASAVGMGMGRSVSPGLPCILCIAAVVAALAANSFANVSLQIDPARYR